MEDNSKSTIAAAGPLGDQSQLNGHPQHDFSEVHRHMGNPNRHPNPTPRSPSLSHRDSLDQDETNPLLRSLSSIQQQGTLRVLAGPAINLVNVIVGVGILGLPFAFRSVGTLPAIALLILVACGTLASFKLLLESSDLVNEQSFPSIAQATLGRIPAIITTIVIILDSFGSLSAFLVIIGDSTAQFVRQYIPASGLSPALTLLVDKSVLMAFSLIIVIPLSLMKNMNSLAFSSFLSLLPLMYLIVVEFVFYGMYSSAGNIHGAPELFASGLGAFVALPIMVFAFSSQVAVFPIYEELKHEKNGTSSDMINVGRVSVALCFVAYLLAGLMGQLTFPTTAQGNIMINYGRGAAVDVLLISMAISVVLGYPLMVFPCRQAIDRLLFPTREPSYVRTAVETMLIITATYAIAALIPSFSTILGLSGSITKTTIGYILPPLFYLKASDIPFKADKLKWLSVLLLIIGTLAGGISTVVTISDFVQGRDLPVNA